MHRDSACDPIMRLHKHVKDLHPSSYVSMTAEIKVLTMRLVAAVVVVGFCEDYGLVEQNGRGGLGTRSNDLINCN